MQYDLSRELSGESKTSFHESQDYVEGKELESGVTLRCTKGRGKGQLKIVWRGARDVGCRGGGWSHPSGRKGTQQSASL